MPVGSRFVEQIETAISVADLFILLLSPAYLLWKWCRRERDLALHKRRTRGPSFIRVVNVSDIDPRRAGFLSEYSWLDVTPPREDNLRAVLRGLDID